MLELPDLLALLEPKVTLELQGPLERLLLQQVLLGPLEQQDIQVRPEVHLQSLDLQEFLELLEA